MFVCVGVCVCVYRCVCVCVCRCVCVCVSVCALVNSGYRPTRTNKQRLQARTHTHRLGSAACAEASYKPRPRPHGRWPSVRAASRLLYNSPSVRPSNGFRAVSAITRRAPTDRVLRKQHRKRRARRRILRENWKRSLHDVKTRRLT